MFVNRKLNEAFLPPNLRISRAVLESGDIHAEEAT
jgi:hypothetical protein